MTARVFSIGELEPGSYARIAVSDDGPGFSEEVGKRLFEPFFTTRPAGTGLGLATVRKIVRDHDGAIDVASAPGKGSRFEVWLPAANTDASTTRRGEPVAPPRLGQGETVLIVHDDRDSLLGDEEILAALGYEPIGFDRPADAIAAVRSEPTRFDAVLISMRLRPGRPRSGAHASRHQSCAADPPCEILARHWRRHARSSRRCGSRAPAACWR